METKACERESPHRMTSSGAGGEITRSRDGVPQWSGDAANFQDYEDAALRGSRGFHTTNGI